MTRGRLRAVAGSLRFDHFAALAAVRVGHARLVRDARRQVRAGELLRLGARLVALARVDARGRSPAVGLARVRGRALLDRALPLLADFWFIAESRGTRRGS
ncbi:conserved hypothetical protein [Burkholderia pseudomallei MSHR346]|nr:conserved hypothetical protein [Burkholderia pseudomallei MSHR346]